LVGCAKGKIAISKKKRIEIAFMVVGYESEFT
jgi:hypothetical protein